jgi:hypothetical protein
VSNTKTIIIVILGCLLLVAANLSLWATLNIFNAARFGSHVAAGLQSPKAAEALAEPIVDRLMASYPELPKIARVAAEEAVAWMLQRPTFTPVFKGVAAVAMTVMTTSAQDVVGIDIAEVASYAGSKVVEAISVLNPDVAVKIETALDDAIATSQEIGKLAIYEQGRFPELRMFSILAPWLTLLLGVGALALYAISYLRAQNQHRALKYIGVGVMITSVLGFLLHSPVVNAVAKNNIIDPTMQIVVGEVVSVLVRPFAIQSLLVFSIGLFVLIYNYIKGKQPAHASVGSAT